MADESANLAKEAVGAALEFSVTASITGFSVLLKIDNTILAGIVSIGALSLGAYYLANRQPVENAIRNGLEGRNEAGVVDPEVRNIEEGSILVELHCHSEQSFIQFVEDFEAKKVKHRLKEEFKKIGFRGKFHVTIRNTEEVYRNVQMVRSSAMKEVEDKEVPKASEALPISSSVTRLEDMEKDDETDPAWVDMISDSEKRLKDISSERQKRLIVCLQPKDLLGNDYRRLADRLGYTNDDIKYLASTVEPVKTLINEKGDMKIVELIPLLEDMERKDVAEELRETLKVTPSPREREERVKARESNVKLMTTCEHYDAFICFAKNDGKFVDLLTKKMEGPPYHLHLCLSERDFLPGGSIHDITAEAIERCSKFVVILSKHFDDSEGEHYESQIALSLSPGAKEKRFIPVLIDEDYRGKIPRSFSHITYLDFLRLEENDFWKKLATSLGWKQHKA